MWSLRAFFCPCTVEPHLAPLLFDVSGPKRQLGAPSVHQSFLFFFCFSLLAQNSPLFSIVNVSNERGWNENSIETPLYLAIACYNSTNQNQRLVKGSSTGTDIQHQSLDMVSALIASRVDPDGLHQFLEKVQTGKGTAQHGNDDPRSPGYNR